MLHIECGNMCEEEVPPPPVKKPGPPPSPPRVFLAGLIPLYALKIIREKPMHGYELEKEIEKRLGHKLPEGAIYVMLRRLEAKGLLRSEWVTSESGPAKRIYYITEEGEAFLRKGIEELKILAKILKELLSTKLV